MDNNFNQLSQIVKGADIGCALLKEIGETIKQSEQNVEHLAFVLKTAIKEMAQLGDNIKASIDCCINAMGSICR